ncbi:GNAT family N-acetyltransferase [Rubinisphaera margarita]|uniref:GNAT family N-acetyltransferase n=1 Tax=Rubinisphaera margarita TaxID=2909586 RepID=UPI001EE7B101|nr:GNAT family N-acetyltransferase [Rubinisphaera margarita]MCG6156772.1 GNAT family N-acetyltransferase [Rubinisphaera margarita]
MMSYTIRPAETTNERRQALMLLMHEADRPSPDEDIAEALKQADRGEIDLSHLLIAAADEQETERKFVIFGSILMIVQPDATGLTWAPMLCDEIATRKDSAAIHNALIEAEVQRALEAGCTYLQASVGLKQDDRAASLLRNGFVELGNMAFMQRPCPRGLQSLWRSSDSGSDVELIPYYLAINDEQLATLIEQTYEESDDFPELQGYRTGLQAVLSHREQGEYQPNQWYVIRTNREPVGVLFFSGHEEVGQVELIYVGIIPRFRKQGIGKKAIALALSRLDGEKKTVFLGVDIRNRPAVKVYNSLGFISITTQRVFYRMVQKQ